jgi:hypothetical protein
MRLLPVTALVLLSLIFSVGGVAINGRADSANQSQTPVASVPAPDPLFDAKPIEKGCKQPEHHVVLIPASRFVAGDTVQLNTRGYNYAAPGEVAIDPTGHEKPSSDLPRAVPAPASPAR